MKNGKEKQEEDQGQYVTRPDTGTDGQEWQPNIRATERNDTMQRRLASLVY